MSVRLLNLGWLVVILLLGQELGQAQVLHVIGATLPDQANALTITWNPSPSPEVVGYVVYWGLSDDSCTNRIVLRNVTNVTLVGFRRRATYHLAVAAYDATGEESPWSNQIQYSRVIQLPSPPQTLTNSFKLQPVNLIRTNSMLRLSFTGQAGSNYRLQTTQDFLRWEDFCATNCDQQQLVFYDLPYSATVTHCFFRVLQE